MNSRIGLLLGLLIVQIALVGVAFLGAGRDEGGEPFLDIDPARITGLTISGGDDDAVVLARSSDGWRLGELPADGGKIADVIGKLTGGSAIWPVATSADSQGRFEVTEDAHQRRIDFEGEAGPLATVYLGTSPGYRRIHARRDGDDATYSIDFAVHELPTDADEWLDKQLLASEGVRRVELPGGQVLAREASDGGWILDGSAAQPEAAQRLVERIERLSVLGRYESVPGAALGEAKTVLLEDDGGAHRLTFRFNEPADEYVLTTDRYPGEFTVASYVAEQILVEPADLLPEPIAGDQAAEVAAEAPAPTAAADSSPDGE
ncbi:MAG TPA: DUF4340 domain-containing protein [Pseudomonadales bacterium]